MKDEEAKREERGKRMGSDGVSSAGFVSARGFVSLKAWFVWMLPVCSSEACGMHADTDTHVSHSRE